MAEISTDIEELARTFNIWDPMLNEDPYPVLRELQAKCPVAHSEELGGYWFVTSYEHVHQVFSDPVTFSSRVLQIPPLDEPPVLIPETLDPPIHTAYRQVMAPTFSPRTIEGMEDEIRERVRSLLSDFVAQGGGDFVQKVALPLPSSVFLRILGLPWEDLDRMLAFRDALMRDLMSTDPAVVEHAQTVVLPATRQHLGEAISERRAMENPSEDLLTAMVTGNLAVDGGRTMTDEEIVNACFLLLAAGLDTVTAVLSKLVATLATRKDLLQQLIDDPALIPGAAEEFLRYWSLVSTCRQAKTDTVLAGAFIKAGDIVNICTPAASRDPHEFFNPDEIDFHRTPNRHLAFGAGPHRCIGSHLARAEITVTIQELISIMPSFDLDPDDPPVQRFGQVLGVDRLALRLPQ
jgi:cytochrome P450